MTPMPPEPCDRAELAPVTVPPLQPWDLAGQLADHERERIADIPLASQEEYL